MNYIKITAENIDSEHICCAMSGKLRHYADVSAACEPGRIAEIQRVRQGSENK